MPAPVPVISSTFPLPALSKPAAEKRISFGPPVVSMKLVAAARSIGALIVISPALVPPMRKEPTVRRSNSASDSSNVLTAASVDDPRSMSRPAEIGCKVVRGGGVRVPAKSIRSAVICAPRAADAAPPATLNLAPGPKRVMFMLKPAAPSKSFAADVLATTISPVNASKPGPPLGLPTPATPLTSPTVNPSESSKPTCPAVVRRATVSTSLVLPERPIVPPAWTAKFATVIGAVWELPSR